jgi:protein-disulfide isomerase
VTIVEFGSFQCPFTKRAEATVAELRALYGDKVRVVWKDEPLEFQERSMPAAELAREARAQKGDAAFWAVHDALFASAPSLADADFERIAAAAGLDVHKAMVAVRAHEHEADVERDLALSDDFDTGGTPNFFINGRHMNGAQPIEKFRAIVEDEIAGAGALVASGTKPEALYDALVANGEPAAPLKRLSLAIPDGAPSKGEASAPVVIQQLSDVACLHCTQPEDELAEIARRYGRKVRLVWRDLAADPNAVLVAEAARAAMAQKGVEGFWKMHDRLLAERWGEGGLARASLDRYAADIGLDKAKWTAALDGHTYAPLVEADRRAASDAGIASGPTFLVGDYVLHGTVPWRLRRLIDRVLEEQKGRTVDTKGVASARWDAASKASRPKLPPGVARPGRIVLVQYTERVKDGPELESTRTGGLPYRFTLGAGQVIKGLDQGLVGMRVGEKRTLTIPPELGYGDRGAPPKIPAGATLVFEVELVEVK